MVNELNDVLEGVKEHLPVVSGSFDLRERQFGIVVIDAVNGFCTVGAGNLAPTKPSDQIVKMIDRIELLVEHVSKGSAPVLVFQDTHDKDRPEPPYPAHCIIGTGEEELVPELQGLNYRSNVTIIKKDCISGWIGGIGEHGNKVQEWIRMHELDTLVVVGICTDICVMDFVLPLLSARNHAINGFKDYGVERLKMLLPSLKDVVVFEPGCATHDLPRKTTDTLGLPPTASHPQKLAHHMGLYVMQARGAILANELILPGVIRAGAK